MAFVYASTNALTKLFRQRAEAFRTASQETAFDQGVAPIRRPYRGIQIKNDTYATMQIVNGAGQIIPLISESYTGADRPAGGKGRVNVYADFIIQQINEERVEKQQILETFGDSFIFFFGERPRVLTISGMLVNTEDFSWRAQFMYNYEHFLRGSRLVQQNARLFLSWDTIVVEGYPINVTATEAADNPYVVNFQMQIFLTNYNNFGDIGVVEFPNPPRTGEELDVLNRELDDASRRFISTTLEVRRLNFESRIPSFFNAQPGTPGSGLGDALRAGMRGINSVFNIASGVIQDAFTILSGRVVRRPIGIAGFLRQVEGGVLGVGLTAELLASMPDTKLRIAKRPQYVIQDPSLLHGRKSLNYDEYPLSESFSESGALLGRGHSLSIRQSIDAINRKATRDIMQTEQTTLEVAANNLAQTEAGVLENISDVVKLAKLGFAIFNTTRAVLNDPVAVTMDSLGISGIENIAG